MTTRRGAPGRGHAPGFGTTVAWALAAALLLTARAEASFGYRRSITINPGQVAGGTQTGFPVLVSISGDAALRTVASGGHVTSALGDDIQFRASDGVTVLDHEIERYDGATGTLVAWVRIPSLSDGTLFYLYYGDATVSCPLANPGSVWDANYRSVYHLGESFLDSTTNHQDATNGGTADTAAQIGRGRDVSLSPADIILTDHAEYMSQFTFSAWVRWNGTTSISDGGTGSDYPRILDKRANGGAGATEKGLFINNGSSSDTVGRLRYDAGDGAWRFDYLVPTATWIHVAVVDDETTAGPPTLYVNGVAQGLTASTPRTTAQPTTESFRYGNRPNGLDRSFDGRIDEIRTSNIQRSANWLLTEYRNQSAPGTFYALGAETVPAAVVAGGCAAAGQAGKDGSLTVGGAGTILNKYATLSANAARGATSLTVTNPGGANGLDPATLTAGDLLLVVQMQGATIDTPNSNLYGGVTSLNGAGLYELVTVASVAGTTVNLACSRGLTNGYTAAGRVQVIRVPQYSYLTVTGSVTAPAWNATGQFYGGIVAVRAEYMTVNGSIDVSGVGFAGAQAAAAGGGAIGFGATAFVTATLADAGPKGEGIAGNVADYDLLGGRYGRGAPANGGGGGCGHNSSGGGGANGHNGLVWNGLGNPDTSVAGWITAWNIDPSLNAATTSSGGGRGGYGISGVNRDALTVPPGDTSWGSDDRREVGGRGGHPLPNDAASRVFMGGGGGACHSNAAVPVCDGGNGGGIAFAFARTISGTGQVLANGVDGGDAVSDGGGGAGAGGSVVVYALASVSGIGIVANGGIGGDGPGGNPGAHGPGGGGGGGFIALSAPTVSGVTRTANGGANGIEASPSLAEFPPNGGTAGGAGVAGATAAAVPGCCLVAAVTAVELAGFEARAGDGQIELQWQTGSETKNLGFLVHRAVSAAGPYTRITDALIPGLGSSPEGAQYRYVDSSLQNGVTYYYELEDVDTSGRTQRHGPVSGTPQAARSGGGTTSPPPDDGPAPAAPRLAHGDPSATSLRILERSARHVLVELHTGGFFSTRLADGSARLEVPSFQDASEPGQPGIPVRRAWIEAEAGSRAEIADVRVEDVQAYALRPEDAPERELQASLDGTVRLVPRRARPRRESGSVFPATDARIVATAFQGETKKAQLEMAPLRYDSARGMLFLARTLIVRLSFRGREDGERGLGGARGRKPPRFSRAQDVIARFAVKEEGLQAVSFEEIFGAVARPLPASWVQLSRQGRPVPFHLEPNDGRFGPGTTLLFVSAGASLNPHAPEAVYELVRTGAAGARMASASAVPAGPPVASYLQERRLEVNRLYQSALLDATDVWMWDYIVARANRAYPFTVFDTEGSGTARLTVVLQGGSDFAADPDHHVRVRLDGTLVAEAAWDGKLARTLQADIPSSLLRHGENRLEIENVGDTGASYSLVMLDRFALTHPRRTIAEGGRLDGVFESRGTATVAGLSAASYLVDVTDAPQWLTGAVLTPQGLAFQVEPGRRYLAVARDAVRRPRVVAPVASSLRSKLNQADYLLVTPREFLEAAQPLLEHRRAQGLSVRAVPVEDVYAEFGFGEASPLALKEFLAFAYHEWSAPSPRYVLLLGDATYDPKDFLKTGFLDRVPGLMIKTPHLWTVSDPAYASVNGDDLLPDLALGRLSAASLAEAHALVAKVLAFEQSGFSLDGPRVLVADNSDGGGPFESNADEIAAGALGGRTEKIYIGRLGGGTRAAVSAALDRGASLMSYVGHGSTVIWASENVFNNMDLPNLAPQPRQPLLFTMNCLNGFFHMPGMSSLAEAFVKAEGKGAVAALAPSGMSVNEPAHVYHKAILEELLSGRHTRLGDALLAAQARYADSGVSPELLAIYQLLGDPALELRD